MLPESITQYFGEKYFSALVLTKEPVVLLKEMLHKFECKIDWITWRIDFQSGATLRIGRLPASMHTIYTYSGCCFHSIYVDGDMENAYCQELYCRLRRHSDEDPIPLQFQVTGIIKFTK